MLYKVYWNNICLLSNLEEAYIKNQTAKNSYFPFSFEYYGLGRQASMTGKIREDIGNGEIDGDIIVSTDLDIFQDKHLAKYFDDNFQKSPLLLPVNDLISKTNIIEPSKRFHPFIVIPLVMVVNTNLLKESEIPQSFEDLLHPSFKHRYAFGGVHNSAGRSLLKSLWYKYGSQAVKQFLSGAVITSMPAQAFQRVKIGEVAVSIVPTIFALRSGINGLKTLWPKEGAVAIPSYVAVKNKVTAEDFDLFSKTILGVEHQLQLKNAGDIIAANPDVPISPLALENNCNMFYPEWSFFETFDHEEFYALCKDYKPF